MDDRMNKSRRTQVLVWIAALALLAAACGGTGSSDTFRYKDPNDLALFDVPNDWNVYTADELTQQNLPFVTNFVDTLPIATVAAFDAGTGRSVANLQQSVSSVRYPVGSYVVRDVSRGERDLLSRASLETLVLWPEFFTVTSRGANDRLRLRQRLRRHPPGDPVRRPDHPGTRCRCVHQCHQPRRLSHPLDGRRLLRRVF